MAKGDKKRTERREKHERLLRLFDGDGYEEFHHPKYVFVKHWNGNTKVWQVAIYTTASWKAKNDVRPSEYQQQMEHLQSIMREE